MSVPVTAAFQASGFGAAPADDRPTDPGVRYRLGSLGLPTLAGHEEYVARVVAHDLGFATFAQLAGVGRRLGVTDEFREVVDYFRTPAGRTPPGFRVELDVDGEGTIRADLVRDISRDADAVLRPTSVLFSADSANPYEIAPIAPFIANLTCNPGIIYDLFLNDPKANVGGAFKDRDEVMAEIGRTLGPGCDISVELNNPFDPDVERLLDEAEHFREMLSRWRVVIKVPHTGPVNSGNVNQLLAGRKKLETRWWEPSVEDAFRGHRLALLLHEHGFRVNFTLMFEPHQTQLALQAKPYFINSFIRHRLVQTDRISALLEAHARRLDRESLVTLREYLIEVDYLSPADAEMDLVEVRAMAERLVAYRQFHSREGGDGLDGVRQNLRALRSANLPDTRLIVCSMDGDRNYREIDQLLCSDEFKDMARRVVITAEPSYLARFTSSSQVISYQRRFMNAVQGAV